MHWGEYISFMAWCQIIYGPVVGDLYRYQWYRAVYLVISVGCARTLFISVFQRWQLPLLWWSSGGTVQFHSSTGTWHSCQSCAVSAAARATQAFPTVCPSLSSFSPHPSWHFQCLLVLPQSSVSTSVFSIYSVVSAGFLYSTYLSIFSDGTSCYTSVFVAWHDFLQI